MKIIGKTLTDSFVHPVVADDVQSGTGLCSGAVKRIFASDLYEHCIKLMAKSIPHVEIHGSY